MQNDLPQSAGQISCRCETIPDSFGHRLQTDLFQFRRNIRNNLSEWLRIVFPNLAQQLSRAGRTERQFATQQMVEHHPKAIDIRTTVDAMSATGSLFRRHVAGSSRNHSGKLAFALAVADCEAEVNEDRLIVPEHHDVGRLEIAMDCAGRVRMGQRICELSNNRHSLRPAIGRPFHPLRQTLSLEVVGHNVTASVRLTDVENRDDPRMAQLSQSLGFNQELIQ